MVAELGNENLRWLVKTDGDSVFGQCLVRVDDFAEPLLSYGLEYGSSLRADLQHGASTIVERFHTCEVPSAKLFKIDDAIFIEVQVGKSLVQLLLVKWRTKLCRKHLQFFFVNCTAIVRVELRERLLHL